LWCAAVSDLCGASLPPSAQGRFVQRKILADMDVTLVSRGVFRFEKGRFFSWQVEKPAPSVFFATPTNWSLTVRGKTTAQPLDVDVSSFEKIFEIKEMKAFVKSVSCTPKSGFPSRVDVIFKNGDRLEIELDQSR
jgi:hypothetical protein